MDHQMMKPTVEIPPRKLVLSPKTSPAESSPRNWNKSKKIISDHQEEDGFNNEEYCYDSDTDDPYASDHFRMFEFKIRRCTRSRSHDWTDCPFAHPGEKARRRDPRRFQYSGEACPEFRRNGDCSRGDDCEFAHGVFECWLHPIHYRTEACKDGKHCKRKVCFFAHSSRQLRVRVLPLETKKNPCCLFCSDSSPKSTLLGNFYDISRSPSQSPPAPKAATFSRLRDRVSAASGSVDYKDVLNELVNSLESMSLAEVLQGSSSSSPVTTPVSAFASTCGLSNQRFRSPLQFALLPSTPSYLTNSPPRRRQMNDFAVDTVRDKTSSFEDGSCGGELDLGWVNDLLT